MERPWEAPRRADTPRLLPEIGAVLAGVEEDADLVRRVERAREIWREAADLTGVPPALAYLHRRRLDPAKIDRDRLRAHPAIPFDGGEGPAIVAPVNDPAAGLVVGIWRVMLTPDGRKIARRGLGVMRGCCSRLFHPWGEILGIAEGIEDALAAHEIFGIPCWAALSATNMPHVVIPRRIRQVFVFADADEPGRRGALELCRRLRNEGRLVRVYEPVRAKDLNDFTMESAS